MAAYLLPAPSRCNAKTTRFHMCGGTFRFTSSERASIWIDGRLESRVRRILVRMGWFRSCS